MSDPLAEVRAARHWAQLDARSPAELTERARDLERRGFEGVVVPQVNEPPWATLGAVAVVTERLRLASGIALAFTRSPVETAYLALHLDAFSGGRFALGLGTSVRSWNVAATRTRRRSPITSSRPADGTGAIDIAVDSAAQSFVVRHLGGWCDPTAPRC